LVVKAGPRALADRRDRATSCGMQGRRRMAREEEFGPSAKRAFRPFDGGLAPRAVAVVVVCSRQE
jgi:hypothetical protein